MVYDGDLWPSRRPPVLFRPWKDTDVQPQLRPAYPTPDVECWEQGKPDSIDRAMAAEQRQCPKSLLRQPLKPGERLVCYCPPGICQAPKGFSGPCNRAER